MNDADVQLQIELAATTSNGSDVPQGFTTVVTNTQTPANPRGDTTTGNFELAFTAQAPFSFPGGGLIIRFSNPSASYTMDTTCTGVTVETDSTDPSGFFVKRFFSDADGLPPYDHQSTGSLGGFRLTLADVPPAPSPSYSSPPSPRHEEEVQEEQEAPLGAIGQEEEVQEKEEALARQAV